MNNNPHYEHLLSQVIKEKHVFIANNAIVIGNVHLGEHSSVWYNAVIRGDLEQITIGNQTNIQDCCVVHADPGIPTNVGNNVIVGHSAILHGCTIGHHSMIGMRATVMNNAKVGNYCIIGAHALVTEGMEIPDYSLVLGSPGKVVKQLNEFQIQQLEWGAMSYVKEAAKYLGVKYEVK